MQLIGDARAARSGAEEEVGRRQEGEGGACVCVCVCRLAACRRLSPQVAVDLANVGRRLDERRQESQEELPAYETQRSESRETAGWQSVILLLVVLCSVL